MKSQETTSKYLLLRGCTEKDNPHVINYRTFMSPVEGDNYCFVDQDGDVFLGPELTSIADGTYTPYSDMLDFDEISNEVSQGKVTCIYPRHTVWHPPFSLAILLLIWCVLLAHILNLWWAALLLIVVGSVPLAAAIGTTLLFGRYHGLLISWWRQ